MPTTAQSFTAYLVDGRYACAGCVPADARDALAASPVTGRDVRGAVAPVTACCGQPVVRVARDEYVVADQ